MKMNKNMTRKMQKMMALAVVAMLLMAPGTALATRALPDGQGQQQEAAPAKVSKAAKKMARKMQKEGWKPLGGEPIDMALQRHYDQLAAAGTGAVAVEGYAEARQLNTAIRMAQTNATIQYAQMMGTEIDGRTLTEISNLTTGEAKSASKFDATYISRVQQLVKALRPSVSFYYQKKDGTYVVRGFYIGKE